MGELPAEDEEEEGEEEGEEEEETLDACSSPTAVGGCAAAAW